MNFKYTRETIAIVVLTALLLGAWLFFLSPQYAKFSQNKASAGQAINELSGLDRELSEIENLSASLDKVQQGDVDKISKMIPYGKNLEDLLANMHKLGQQSGMLITSLYVHQVEDEAASSEIPLDANGMPVTDPASAMAALMPSASAPVPQKLQMTMSVKGNYADLITFLELIERHARLIDVETVGISSLLAENSSSEILTVNITAYSYFIPEVPKEPTFPYGTQIDLSMLDKEQFKLLQTLPGITPVESAPTKNPFAPR